MNFIQKNTKIIATIGPSSDNYEKLKEMVLSGVSIVRINFSHGDRKEQLRKFELAKRISKELNIPLPIMLDTKGPEVRVGKIKDGETEIKANSIFVVKTDPESYQNLLGDDKLFAVSYRMDRDLRVDSRVLFDDGKLAARVLEIKPNQVKLLALNSHTLKSCKRINIPGVDLNLPFLSEKDIADVIAGVKAGASLIAASFVNSPDDIKQLREIIKDRGVKIIAKIETMTAIRNIQKIIESSDGIMVARGDLGLEISFQDVPYHQEIIIKECRKLNKPVVVATQMLDSMEHSLQPTRAEVSDVYYATKLGADATMLSGETAQGDFPLESVKTMSLINRRGEQTFFNSRSYDDTLVRIWKNSSRNDEDRIAYQLALRTSDWDYRYLIVVSEDGDLVEKISHYRPKAKVIAVLKPKNLEGINIRSGIFVSKDSAAFFKQRESKKDFGFKKILEPFFPEKGDRYLVLDAGKVSEFVYS